jgi:hypothetical protein
MNYVYRTSLPFYVDILLDTPPRRCLWGGVVFAYSTTQKILIILSLSVTEKDCMVGEFFHCSLSSTSIIAKPAI